MKVKIKFIKNIMLYPLTGKVFVDGEFLDYIKINQGQKELLIANGSDELYVKIGIWKTNQVSLSKFHDPSQEIELALDSKIQNGFFVFAMVFFGLSMLTLVPYVSQWIGNKFIGIVLLIPLLILALRQYFEKEVVFIERVG